MSDKLDGLIEEVSLSSDQRDVSRVLRRVTARWGFQYFCYLRLSGAKTYALSNYPQIWQKRYFECSYYRIDPVIQNSMSKKQMFAWSGTAPQAKPSRQVLRFFEEAAELGIRSGISIPVSVGFGSTAILTFASGQARLAIEDLDDPIKAAAAATLVHAYLTLLDAVPTSTASPRLTPRQALCLKWSAEGKTMEEIAMLLRLAKTSVRFHLDEARTRLDAMTLQQATAIATTLNLV
ncbi:autoinducer binding domain-containing protein [Neorhizobium galegae]|uniref:autoinducer binding domain-containing protein n=1 Tax=Neorhizobium galegae TaxID=399 RepID=UPI000621921C|nr:autoinducer binding domain-containing protein [Neorhizobium galegae]MCQ1768145.1 autoinducer binding domain-containing protein [Neorhizobium galegae]MCQ1847117.1 autoinducer binding domain-containing protein [Neorhizobium galegae]CDZ29945.1 Transcriptional activator protein TraR [Neorhizobium galegae bv. officinalis]